MMINQFYHHNTSEEFVEWSILSKLDRSSYDILCYAMLCYAMWYLACLDGGNDSCTPPKSVEVTNASKKQSQFECISIDKIA